MKNLMQWIDLAVILLVLSLSNEARGGLIAEYNFDETGGAIAHDSVGSVNGTLIWWSHVRTWIWHPGWGH